ncbi:MAG: FecR family protein [Ginsengibacter sp.]
MEYKNYQAEDFVMEESFQHFCLGIDKEAVDFWTNWIISHPHKNSEFNIAKEMCYILSGNNNTDNYSRDQIAFRRLLINKGISPLNSIGKNEGVTVSENAQPVQQLRTKQIPIYKKIAVAASVLFMVGFSIYFIFVPKTKNEIVKNNNTPQKLDTHDAAPGGSKATLTLANGSIIILEDADNGTLSEQGNIKIIKLNDGELAYNTTGDEKNIGTVYNTISTPKGGQYQILLADGSKVWLNAASSLHFPTSFTNKERHVELTGEGYFEVANNASMPFKIKVNDTEIEVLGTQFNISAYENEDEIKTTLLEGSVKINKGSQSVTLKPGEEALDRKRARLITVKKVIDAEASVAWKNGYFQFENLTINQIMRQISRWYDVDVIYEGKIPLGHYVGKPSRDLNLSEIIKLIKISGVEIVINNNTVIVKE